MTTIKKYTYNEIESQFETVEDLETVLYCGKIDDPECSNPYFEIEEVFITTDAWGRNLRENQKWQDSPTYYKITNAIDMVELNKFYN